MNVKKISARISALCGIGMACLALAPASAQETNFKVYGGMGYVSPMGDSDVTFGSVTDSVEAEKRAGWDAGFEFRGKLVGLEFDYMKTTHDVDFGGATIGETDFTPLTATLNFHLVHTNAVDFYLGPSYAYVNWGDVSLNGFGQSTTGSSSDVGTDSDHGWGASLGLDFGFGPHFAITGGLRYLNVDLKLDNNPAVSVNPLVARLGVALRF